ncbi:MAG TPA: hypothetical protein VME42_10770 [Steroidobacteraceae bacterium]|nr:hypothetical protein [Steroidobacteraceae bacterium]
MIHEGILRYRNARYLWVALGLLAASVALYATQGGLRPAGGGTWQGYTLGTLGALIILWLAWLGIRKRSYASTSGSVAGWTSAHVYLGLALVAIATLHCAGRFGWNVHTLAYALTCAVVLTGILGLYTYLSFPRQLSANRAGGPRSQLFAELYALDQEGRDIARRCNASIDTAVKTSIERTALGGGVLDQLLGRDRSRVSLDQADAGPGASPLRSNADQQAVIDYVSNRVTRADKRIETANLEALVLILCRRQAVLRRIRRDIRLHAWLKAWLYFHIPLTIALIAALIAHILATFLYW